MPLELENHTSEVNNMPSDELDYDLIIGRLREELKNHLTEKELRLFHLLNFDSVEEKDVGPLIGLKARPNSSVAQQLAILKDKLLKKVKKALQNSDIPELWKQHG
jgi:hypothetical protein